jgi:hypothetical protein
MSDQPTPFRSPPSGFSALDHIARARQYRRAAEKLADMEGAEPCWPKYFLLGHAIELALKAVPEYFKQYASYQAPTAVHAPVGEASWARRR